MYGEAGAGAGEEELAKESMEGEEGERTRGRTWCPSERPMPRALWTRCWEAMAGCVETCSTMRI